MSSSHAALSERKAIAAWLLLCCTLVFAMVILGGVTRLTGSGLSMVEWDPIFGIVPPLSQETWESVFEKYQASPEYAHINFGMDLSGFKSIYWFEYAHRLLGRSIGMVFFVPFLYFLFRKKIPRGLAPQLLILFILGGLQGLLGWYMVKSGLVDKPHVSQYRLTAHLGFAVIIYGYILWIALGLLFRPAPTAPSDNERRLTRWTTALTALVFVTILSGGFVAGLKAGFAYNTFPLMGGQWIPDGLFMETPLVRNFFENIITVQFDHRVLATLTFCAVALLWWKALRSELPRYTRLGFHLLMAMAMVQVSLGISTLLLHVPIPLASSHQAGALLLFTTALTLTRRLHLHAA